MERNLALDILKLLLATMVIGIHTKLLNETNECMSYIACNGLFRVAVPLFLIVNGYYFHASVADGRSEKWFKRSTILYICWMSVYSFFWFQPDEFSSREVLKYVSKILVGYYHLWYVSGMVFAAFMLVLLRRFGAIPLAILAAILFLFGVAIQYAGNYHLAQHPFMDRVLNINVAHRNFLFLSFPFFYLGYAIRDQQIEKRISLGVCKFAAFAGVLALLVESYLNFLSPDCNGGFDNLLGLAVACPALFLVAAGLNVTGQSKKTAAFASALYFTHPLAILFLLYLGLPEGTGLWSATLFLASLLSMLAMSINSRVKWLL